MTDDLKKQLFDKYFELSTNVSDEDLEMAIEFLNEMGLDEKEIASEGQKSARRISFLANATFKQIKDQTLLEQVQERFIKLVKKNSEVAGRLLMANLSTNQASFQFRNLEKWSENQMRDVLNDLDLAKLMEDLEGLEDR